MGMPTAAGSTSWPTSSQAVREIFAEFEENYLPDSIDGDGDVKYHLGFSSDRVTADGQHDPPVADAQPEPPGGGQPRRRGPDRGPSSGGSSDRDRKLGMPLLIHGDAAFAGQGLVAETLNLSQLAGLHAPAARSTSSSTTRSASRPRRATPARRRYCTDVAKMIEVPIFHVNGEDPEACVYVAELAVEFRQTFNQDVVIDMYLLPPARPQRGRRAGVHPAAHVRARSRTGRRVSEVYTEQLDHRRRPDGRGGRGDRREVPGQAAGRPRRRSRQRRRRSRGMPRLRRRTGRACSPQYSHDAGRDRRRRTTTLRAIADAPDDACPRASTSTRRSRRMLEAAAEDVAAGSGPIDWAFAEALAFGSLLLEGTPVRLSGQDSRRGTFSQRHAVLFDVADRRAVRPAEPPRRRARPTFCVYDSLLSEAAVLGFEFGYSLDAPDTLVLWEAQFGDFANGAQVIIDQFIACSRVEVAARQRPGHAPAARLRGPGAGALQRPPGALPAAVRRGQHPGRATRRRRRSTSTCCAGRCSATSASRWS